MARSRLPLTSSFVAEFCQRLSRQNPVLHLARGWLEQRLVEQGLSIEQLVQAEIVGGYTGIASNVDPNDPTTLQFESYYQPIFPLEYLCLTFNLRAQI